MSEEELKLQVYDDVKLDGLTAEKLNALSLLAGGEIPDSAVKKHIGKGGKTFTYIDHVWVTRQLRDAFGQAWSFDVSDPVIHSDGSASVICKLEVSFPLRDGSVLETHISEIGAWEDSSGKMPHAMRIASAASRGLVRCAFRRFGIGEQFYGSDNPEITSTQAWNAIATMGIKRGLTKQRVVEIMQSLEIDSENIVDRYVELYKAVFEAGDLSGED